MESETFLRMRTVILNITHGDNVYCAKKYFLPIAAGACRHDITNDACGEDNISEKNKWYGDSTSLYWAWKNLKRVDIIGTSHYRRFLADVSYLEDKFYWVSWDDFCKSRFSVSSYKRDLRTYDFLMAFPIQFDETIRDQYIKCHPFPRNLEIARNVLLEIHPESVSSWDEYMNGHTLRFGFLFITTWTNFDKLCSWLFPVLRKIEEQINVEEFDGYQQRVIAFLYERLVPVFLMSNNMKVKSYPMYYIDDEADKTKINSMKRSYWKNHSIMYSHIRDFYRGIVSFFAK